MPDQLDLKDRVQLALQYWAAGNQKDLAPVLGVRLVEAAGKKPAKDSKPDAGVSKKLSAGLTPAQVLSVAQHIAKNISVPDIKLNPENLRDAFQGSDATFLRYLSRHSADAVVEIEDKGAGQGTAKPARTNGHSKEAHTQVIGIDGFDTGDLRTNVRRVRQSMLKGNDERIFLYYRLGYNAPPGTTFSLFDDKLRPGARCPEGLVIRRIAAKLSVIEDNPAALSYEEYYGDLDGTLYPAHAAAYAFDNFLTIFARDPGKTALGELSLTQIDWRSGNGDRRLGNADRETFYPGVVTMKSDCSGPGFASPTSYRVLLRPVDLTWNDAKAKAQGPNATKVLGDITGDGVIDLRDGIGWGDEDDVLTGHAIPWRYYFNRLNVRETPADLLVAWQTDYMSADIAGTTTA